MAADKLTLLQRRIVRVLAPLSPPWTLTGGGALAGVHLGHRTTRDLDLFWRARPTLEDTAAEALALLHTASLDAVALRTSPMFSELRVSDGTEVCVVDLVAEPFPPVEPPLHVEIDGAAVAVDTKHEILVSKLAALLGRTELRDLIDVQALLAAGTDLAAAVRDAPKKDGGFSAMTLAWVLQGFEVAPLARALGWPDGRAADADGFRRELIQRLMEISKPE